MSFSILCWAACDATCNLRMPRVQTSTQLSSFRSIATRRLSFFKHFGALRVPIVSFALQFVNAYLSACSKTTNTLIGRPPSWTHHPASQQASHAHAVNAATATATRLLVTLRDGCAHARPTLAALRRVCICTGRLLGPLSGDRWLVDRGRRRVGGLATRHAALLGA